MTLALRYSIRSDVGLLREGNEDSAYAGPHLLAVADGMGGHAAGEVASAATITTLASLDSDPQSGDLVAALEDAVARANLRLQELIISDPAIEGMGTTLTALLWSEGYGALCHIGDSRAYLLRNGQFVQITHDHTLVQSLVDEGKITEDDVATHPHRSLLLRALDGRTIAEPDLNTIETQHGDRFLLCSDGLSGVVTEQTLHQTLGSIRDPDKAALQLVDLAIRGGGPDNITVIVADVLDTQSSQIQPTWKPSFAGAAAHGAPTETQPPTRQSSPATRAMRLTRTAPQQALPDEPTTGVWPAAGYRDGYGTFDSPAFEPAGYDRGDTRTGHGGRARDTAAFERSGPDTGRDDLHDGGRRRGGHRATAGRDRHDDADNGRGRRRWPIVTGALALLVLLVGGGLYGAWQYNQHQYYVGVKDGYVAIFRGSNQSLAGINLSSLVSRSTLRVSELRASDQATLSQTISQGSVNDAMLLIDRLQTNASQCQTAWQALATWQAKNTTYQQALTHNRTSKKKVPVPANPGSQPAKPDSADCAPSTAFGIPASALPNGQPPAPVTTPAPPPSKSPTAKASTKATMKPTARATGTRAKASPSPTAGKTQ
jgi:PPM family protein phosphatase